MFFWNKYPFIRISMFLSLGILQAYYFPFPFQVTLAIWLLSILFLWAISVALKKSRFRKQNVLLGITLSASIYLAGNILLQLNVYKDHKHKIQLSPDSISYITTEIKEELGQTAKYNKWIAEVNYYKSGDQWHVSNEKVLVYFPKDNDLMMGDVVLLSSKLIKIKAPALPYAFNYQEYMLRQSIRFVSYVHQERYRILQHNPPILPLRLSSLARNTITDQFTNHFENARTRGILLALFTGDKSHIDSDTSATFKQTGIIHILAVSGLHVGIIFLLINLVLWPLKQLEGGKWIRLILTVLLLILFAMLTGLSPSVNRAVLMLVIVQLGNTINRQSNILNSIFLSMFILLIINPYYLFEVGFQLSYAAVLGIVLFYPVINDLYIPLNKSVRKVYQLLVVSLSAQIGTLPFVLFYFHQFPVYFLISNLLAIPFAFFMVSIGMLFLILTLSFSDVTYLTGFIKGIGELFFITMTQIEKLPFAVLSNISINQIQAFLLAAILFFTFQMLWSRRPAFLKIVLIFAISFVSFDMYSKWESSNRCELIEYNLPGQQGLFELVNGLKSYMVLADLSPEIVELIKFHTEGYCLRKRHIPEFISVEDFLQLFTVKETDQFLLFNWDEHVYMMDKFTLRLIRKYKINDEGID